MIITPLTELDAVNEILTSIGSDSVVTLEEIDQNIDASVADKMLKSVSQEIQQEGWDFNTIPTITLVPDATTHRIKWDSSLLRVPNTYRNRGGFFFNVSDYTDVFTENLILTNVVQELPFEELPMVFRKYITVKASLAFAVRFLGDAELEQSLNTELVKAYADVMTYELDTQKPNVFNNTSVTEVGTR